MTDLSVLIPARNEMFLGKTIQSLLDTIKGDTEIIVVLDGSYPTEPIPVHPKVSMIYHSESIGQRAATNEAAKISSARYLAKVDAHCSFDDGWDVKMMEIMQDDWTVAPIMRNLHAFDWVCKECGHRIYQAPTPDGCPSCKGEMYRDVVWIAKTNPQSASYCFDSEPHFQYFGEYLKRNNSSDPLTESMSLQGSFFMLTRKKYFELNVCDEEWGSWGSQGIEVACKTWLSGGKVMINHNTWYAHMFRTQGGDFGFPYPISGHQVEHAKKTAKNIFFTNKWEKQTRPLSWLVEKFWPVPGWTDDALETLKKSEPEARKTPTSGILYYTDNRLDEKILRACQKQLIESANGRRIVSVSLKPIEFGDNIVLDLERGYLTMFKQILIGLEELDTEFVFFAEHDVLYHPSHFDFVPPNNDRYYYNLNCWKVRIADGHALKYETKQTSQLCANRALLILHYKERIRRVEAEGFSRRMGFEPGSHGRPERVDNVGSEVWVSEYPNLDIRHDKNLTPSRWNKNEFRNERSCRDWQEVEEVFPWYKQGEFNVLLESSI